MKRLIIVLGVLLLLVVVAAGAFFLTRGTSASTPAASSGPEVEYYTCSMHPFIHEAEPGNCPVCGMKLQPVYKNTPNAGAGDMPEAPGTVRVSVEEERLLGIRTVVAKRGDFDRTIRTVGRVEVSEDRLEHVHTRFEGWIDQLFVNSVGQPVRRGEPLFTVYSPQIVSSQEEYLLALRARDALGSSHEADATAGIISLLAASRDRLRLLEVSNETIRRLETTQEVERTLTVTSPVSGYVQDRNVTAGQRIMPGMDLYVIADLTHVWVTADVFERDLGSLRIGQRITATFAGERGKEYEGRVSFIYPYLDEATRTNKVRIALDNPDLKLKPGMFGEITIASPITDTFILVPVDAVMITGNRDIVFRRTGPGVYTPVEVKIGDSANGFYQILSGLKEGDIVVERGNFFLDSESQLRMTGAGASPHAGHAAGQENAPEQGGSAAVTTTPSGGADKPVSVVAPPAAPSAPHRGH